jgi:hypothetical protein
MVFEELLANVTRIVKEKDSYLNLYYFPETDDWTATILWQEYDCSVRGQKTLEEVLIALIEKVKNNG